MISMFIDFIMLCLGINGMYIGFLKSMYYPDVMIGSIVLSLYCFLLLYERYNNKKLKACYIIIGIVIVINSVMILNTFDLIRLLAEVIYTDNFLNFKELFDLCRNTSLIYTNGLLVLLGIPFVHMLIHYKIESKIKYGYYFIFISIFILPVFLMHKLVPWTSYCFVTFIIYEFIFSLCHRSTNSFFKIFVLSLLCISCLLSHVTLYSQPIFEESFTDILMVIRDNIEQRKKGKNDFQVNVLGSSSFLDGHLPNNNVKVSNEIALLVESNKSFDGYLRGYSLQTYENNQWVLEEEGYEGVDLDDKLDHFNIEKDDMNTFKVRITPKKKSIYDYTVYYTDTDYMINDSYYSDLKETLTVYDTSDLTHGDVFNEESYFKTYDYDYYRDYIYKYYLNVPRDIELELKRYLIENDIYYLRGNSALDYYETLNYIDEVKDVLSKNTTYSLRCGALPNNDDFILHFLNDSKTGSCSHYASAGAMLLRVMGFPTRYVKGYVISKEDFLNNKAVIREYRSHSWIEIYIKDEGWIPYDMTPSSSDVVEVIDNNVQKDNPDIDIKPINPNNVNINDFNNNTNNINKDIKKDYTFIYYILCGIIIVMLLGIYRYITYDYFYKKLKKMNSNDQIKVLYRRMSELGDTDDSIVQLALKAKFSLHDISKEELDKMYNYYYKYINEYYNSVSFIKKIKLILKGYK